MNLLLKQARIVALSHPENNSTRDILITDGIIRRIAAQVEAGDAEVISAEGLCVSAGWMDLRVNFRDPGQEHKEDALSGLRAARNGGFTAVGHLPGTSPVVDDKAAVNYLLNKSQNSGVRLIPFGALSKNMEGTALAEMYDMYRAGALAFTDDRQSLADAGMLLRALQYASQFHAPILHFPFDASLARRGQMHEGRQSVSLGLKGIPALAEELMVQRDLQVLAYAGGRLHLGPLSSAAAVAEVAQARRRGLQVSCDVPAAHLCYTDQALTEFDSNYKHLPPLRDEENRRQLIAALQNGDIDIICSDHSPEDEEHKKVEFAHAQYGSAGLESFFPLLWQHLGAEVELDVLVQCFTGAPRRLLGIAEPELAEGARAELTVFSTALDTVMDEQFIQSKAYNVAERGHTLKGKVLRTIVPEVS